MKFVATSSSLQVLCVVLLLAIAIVKAFQAPSSWASASASSSSDETPSGSGFGGETKASTPKGITPSPMSFVKDDGDGYIRKVLKDDDKGRAPPAPTLAYVPGGCYGYGAGHLLLLR